MTREIKDISDIFETVAELEGFLFIPEIVWHANFSRWLRELELQRGQTINWDKVVKLEKEYRVNENAEGNMGFTISEIAWRIDCTREFLISFLKRSYRLSGLNEETWEKFSKSYKELFRGTQHLRLLSLNINALKYRETLLQVVVKSKEKRKGIRGKDKGKLVDRWAPQNLGWHILSKRDQP